MNKSILTVEESWLSFNERVLQEAQDAHIPLIERLRFLGIFSNNLDEFFKVRYAAVRKSLEIYENNSKRKYKKNVVTNKKLLEKITNEVLRQQESSNIILKNIHSELEKENILIVDENSVPDQHNSIIQNFFIDEIMPRIAVTMLGQAKDFSRIKDYRLYLIVKIILSNNNKSQKTPIEYALIEIPSTINRFIILPDIKNKRYIILLEDIIRYCLHDIFRSYNYKHIESHAIKISRDSELNIKDDTSKGPLETISKEIRKRRTSQTVRLVYDNKISPDAINILQKKLRLSKKYDSIMPSGRYLNKRDYMHFPEIGPKKWLFKKISSLELPGFKLKSSFFQKVKEKDFLLITPFQKFQYITQFLQEAAIDPKVKTIKLTLYRLAKKSQIVQSLINAARNGKNVTVQIELRARFDEEANVKWSELMKSEGINLINTISELKVHGKVCIVDRREGNTLKRYGFISTGNMNETNAKVYTDLTLFTTNKLILTDVNNIFKFLNSSYKIRKYNYLIVSPHYTRKEIYQLINNEIKNANKGKKSAIQIKLNNLSDKKMIQKLYQASKAGVPIKIIARSICTLVPQVHDLSENIEAISIVGQFLEHYRVFSFYNNGDRKVFISSSDLMKKNLDHRVEVTCPIFDKDIQQQIIDIFNICWSDNVKARLYSDDKTNKYRKVPGKKINSQLEIYNYLKKRNELH